MPKPPKQCSRSRARYEKCPSEGIPAERNIIHLLSNLLTITATIDDTHQLLRALDLTARILDVGCQGVEVQQIRLKQLLHVELNKKMLHRYMKTSISSCLLRISEANG
jgi:hypothetical protein